MFSIMLFIFLCFFGILAVLYHMLRSQEKFCRALREEHAQMRVLLHAMELRLDALDSAQTPSASHNHTRSATRLVPQPAAQPAADPLLHLSFDEPAAPQRATTPSGIDPALDLHFDPTLDAASPVSGAGNR